MSGDNNNIFDKYIYSYSHSQALEDGVLVDVSETAIEVGFKYPVAVTEAVWDNCIKWDEGDTEHQKVNEDLQRRLWDVLLMLKYSIRKSVNTDQIHFKLALIPRDGKSLKATEITLKAVIHGDDHGEPVFTIMFPDED
jgi:hypothetical protein